MTPMLEYSTNEQVRSFVLSANCRKKKDTTYILMGIAK